MGQLSVPYQKPAGLSAFGAAAAARLACAAFAGPGRTR